MSNKAHIYAEAGATISVARPFAVLFSVFGSLFFLGENKRGPVSVDNARNPFSAFTNNYNIIRLSAAS